VTSGVLAMPRDTAEPVAESDTYSNKTIAGEGCFKPAEAAASCPRGRGLSLPVIKGI
jgi:hypothetical protein